MRERNGQARNQQPAIPRSPVGPLLDTLRSPIDTPATLPPSTLPLSLLAAAVLGFYLIAYTAAQVLGRRWAVIAYLLPLVGVVVVAAVLKRPEVALGAALSGAVASLGLVAGLSLMQRRTVQSAPASASSWSLLVPAAVVILLVGVSGHISGWQAGLLLILGVLSLMAQKDDTEEAKPETWKPSEVELLQLAAVVLLAGLAGWACAEAARLLALRHVQASAGLLAACVLGPATTMPLLGVATSLALEGKPYQALGLCVRFTLGAALVITPLAALVFMGVTYASSHDLSTFRSGIPFPLTLWRVESVLLIALGALLIPIAAGRVIPKRRDGFLLFGIFVIYLVLSMLSGVRLI